MSHSATSSDLQAYPLEYVHAVHVLSTNPHVDQTDQELLTHCDSSYQPPTNVHVTMRICESRQTWRFGGLEGRSRA